jgi:GNAT superfamily N-acetyltransferase
MIPTKADLARLDLDNEIELWSTGAAFAADWASGREGDVAWFASGLPVAFFNQVVATGDAADAAALVRAVSVLRGRDVPFLVRLRDGIDDAAVPAIEALGLHEDHDEAYPAMALHPIPADVGGSTVAGELEIRQAIDAAGLEDHLAVVSAGFRMPIELTRRLVPVEELGVPGIAVHVGYLGNRPVATSMGYTSGGTIGVYNVATLDDARRRGYGAAVTRRAVADGASRGATVAILQSSTMGRPVYEAIGFREVLAFRVFLDDRPA